MSPQSQAVACKSCMQNFCAHTSHNGWNARETDWHEAREAAGEFFNCPAEMTIFIKTLPSLRACFMLEVGWRFMQLSDCGSNKTRNFCSGALHCSTQEVHAARRPRSSPSCSASEALLRRRSIRGTRTRTLELFVPGWFVACTEKGRKCLAWLSRLWTIEPYMAVQRIKTTELLPQVLLQAATQAEVSLSRLSLHGRKVQVVPCSSLRKAATSEFFTGSQSPSALAVVLRVGGRVGSLIEQTRSLSARLQG